jgi:hypothetical protein
VVVVLDRQPTCVLCRKSTNLSWEGDEPSATVAEEEVVLPAEESAPTPQAEPEAPAAEATLPEAIVVEGEYSAKAVVPPKSSRSHSDNADALVFSLTGVEAEGNDIPSVVPVENLTPGT